MNKQPKITVETEQIDHVLTGIAYAFLIFMLVVSVLYYSKLPDQIPIHFNAAGDPDRYGDKVLIFSLPVIAVILVLGLQYLTKFPHTYNYLVQITEENAHYQYQKATRMVRALNVITTAIFSYIFYGSIQVALGKWHGLGSGFLIISMVILFGTMFYFIIQSKKQTT